MSDHWFNFKTNKVLTPKDLLKRLSPEQLMGVRAKSQKTIREYHAACYDLLPDRAPKKKRRPAPKNGEVEE